MHHRSLLWAQFFVVAIIAALHLSGIEYHLYWRFLWLDLITHSLGGVWVGLFFFWVRASIGYAPRLAWGIGGAIVIGVAWEIFEVVTGMPREANYALDTSIDLLMDTFGGIVGAFSARFILRHGTTLKTML